VFPVFKKKYKYLQFVGQFPLFFDQFPHIFGPIPVFKKSFKKISLLVANKLQINHPT